MFMVCFSIFRFITQYRTNTLERFLLFCKKKKSVMIQTHRCKKSHLQSNNAPTSRLLTAGRRSSQNICFRSDRDHTWMQRYILQSETSYSDHSLQHFERKAQHTPNHLKHQTYWYRQKSCFELVHVITQCRLKLFKGWYSIDHHVNSSHTIKKENTQWAKVYCCGEIVGKSLF